MLGTAYLATYAAQRGFYVGVLDAEAHGLSIDHTIQIIKDTAPRWAGLNLLAPTYDISARIAAALDPCIRIMLGGHQAKAMPAEILADPRMSRCAFDRVLPRICLDDADGVTIDPNTVFEVPPREWTPS